jgi:hypothetical protein
MIDGSSGWWVEGGWWVHREIEHLQGGPLAEELAAVAGDFAQPGASATMHNIAPESKRRMRLSTGQHSVRWGSFLNPFFSPGGSGLRRRSGAGVKVERPAGRTT